MAWAGISVRGAEAVLGMVWDTKNGISRTTLGHILRTLWAGDWILVRTCKKYDLTLIDIFSVLRSITWGNLNPYKCPKIIFFLNNLLASNLIGRIYWYLVPKCYEGVLFCWYHQLMHERNENWNFFFCFLFVITYVYVIIEDLSISIKLLNAIWKWLFIFLQNTDGYTCLVEYYNGPLQYISLKWGTIPLGKVKEKLLILFVDEFLVFPIDCIQVCVCVGGHF